MDKTWYLHESVYSDENRGHQNQHDREGFSRTARSQWCGHVATAETRKSSQHKKGLSWFFNRVFYSVQVAAVSGAKTPFTARILICQAALPQDLHEKGCGNRTVTHSPRWQGKTWIQPWIRRQGCSVLNPDTTSLFNLGYLIMQNFRVCISLMKIITIIMCVTDTVGLGYYVLMKCLEEPQMKEKLGEGRLIIRCASQIKTRQEQCCCCY